MTTRSDVVLSARGITRTFRARGSGERIHALRGLDLEVPRGAAVGLVGESGCGKSTFARIAAGLLDADGGELQLLGQDGRRRGRGSRGRPTGRVQMIFQDPRASLDPRMSVARIVAEPRQARHLPAGRDVIRELLDRVGLDAGFVNRYPHELSGGQCQRVAIARAISAEPDLIIADEPVSALDVSVQAQVLNLLKDLQESTNAAVLLISHDLGVIRFFCDDVHVVYLGRVVEHGDTTSVLSEPQHPYTEALASAAPAVSLVERPQRIVLLGDPPRPERPPSGCAFHSRCHRRIGPICDEQDPSLVATPSGAARCHLLHGAARAAGSFDSASTTP